MPRRAALLASLLACNAELTLPHGEGAGLHNGDCGEPSGWGFWSEGLQNGDTRTVYDAANEGTAANPLQLAPCLYNQPDPLLIDPPGCNTGPAVYTQSNAWTSAAGWPADEHWVLLMNNEPAFNGCNPGPPDASLPRAEPGAGTMGYLVQPDDSGSLLAHLVLDNAFPNPCGAGAIPFLAFGAHQNRGNRGQPIVAVHPQEGPSHAAFVAKLHGIRVVDTDVGASWMFMVTEWPRADGTLVPRMLFLLLGSWSRNAGWSVEQLHRHWSWPIVEGVLAPGADIAFLSAAAARQSCGLDVPTLYASDDVAVGRELAYDIDVSRLYDCASGLDLFDEPVPPTADLPVRGVFWASEVARAGSSIWTSFRDVRTHRAHCGASPSCGPDQYCWAGVCQPRPELVQAPLCSDLGMAHPAPDFVSRYTVYGRPGATVHKYNRKVSCAGAPAQLGGESPFAIGAGGSVTFSFPLDVPLSDCAHPLLGRYESWAVVDGIRSNVQETTFYNSACANVATCAAGASACP